MTSETNIGLAETTEKLVSMSLGASASKSEAKAGTTEKFCSACGKSGTNLKKCTACKCLYYCDVICQKSHREEHKWECKRIRKVLEKRGDKESASPLEALGDIPQREECPICMRPLPHIKRLHQYQACCGKRICGGCGHAQILAVNDLIRKRAKGMDLPEYSCAFCRAPDVTSDEEAKIRMMIRAEKNDAGAIAELASQFEAGAHGMPLDKTKSFEFRTRAANLGDEDSCFAIGFSYYTGSGVVRDKAKGWTYLERAAKKGHIFAGLVLGHIEISCGNHRTAMRHWRVAAACGGKVAAEELVTCYELGYIRHGDLAESLQARDNAFNDHKSEARDAWLKFLEKTGQLNADDEIKAQRMFARRYG